MRLMIQFVLFLSAVFICPLCAQAASFEWIENLYNYEGYITGSAAFDVSDDGAVVVGFVDEDDSVSFRWTPIDGMSDIPGFTFGSANAISADGSTIVGTGDNLGIYVGPAQESYRWTYNEGTVPLGFLPGDNQSRAFDVSADGSIVVGQSWLYSFDDGDNVVEAYRWTEAAGMIGLGHLFGDNISVARGVSANGAVVVGDSCQGWGPCKAFRWTQDGGMVDLSAIPGASDSTAYAASADGSVVVGVSGDKAFRWTESDGPLSLGAGVAYDVSSDGNIVVGESDGEAFIWDPINGMRRLKDVLVSEFGLDLDGCQLENASAVSDDGSAIVGWGSHPDVDDYYWGWDSQAWIAQIDPICTLPVGHVDYCSTPGCGPCGVGEGDCDGDSQCKDGLVCAQDVGSIYGLPWNYDVCEAACPDFVAGPDACTSSCPCGEGQGDCDSDADCASGLVCVQNVGANYGWPVSRDVCEAACPDFVAGPDACTSSCPCGEGQGDCDSDADCASGLVCVQNVGANYGWPASRDVCEAACPDFVAGPDACTSSCPCGEGQGDCDSDADCAPGLVCVQNVGANYGWPVSRDVCESPGGPGDCRLDDRFESGVARTAEPLYTDRAYTITGGVPDWMVGRTLIQTPNDERSNSSASGYLRFTVPVSYWVYVLFDSRSSSVPAWLSSWERRSQYQMKTSLGTQPYLKFYRKWFDAGECVDLGGNYGPGSSNEYRSNYLVVYGK